MIEVRPWDLMTDTNEIAGSAHVGPQVKLGRYNQIGSRVTLEGDVTIGDCCRIEDDARILAGKGHIVIGDWAVMHNHCFLGPGDIEIGHNLWLGQGVWLDGTGGLRLGNGVRIGTESHVWTHAAAAEQFEGGLYHTASTVLEDDVWLVGDTVTVNPGVIMAGRSVALAHSVVTKHTLPGKTYAGIPAREVDMPFWREVSRAQRWQMMLHWVAGFCEESGDHFRVMSREYDQIEIHRGSELLAIGFNVVRPEQVISASAHDLEQVTLFDLTTKRYTKRLTALEREFYRFVYGNKIRFVPETS